MKPPVEGQEQPLQWGYFNQKNNHLYVYCPVHKGYVTETPRIGEETEYAKCIRGVVVGMPLPQAIQQTTARQSNTG